MGTVPITAAAMVKLVVITLVVIVILGDLLTLGVFERRNWKSLFESMFPPRRR